MGSDVRKRTRRISYKDSRRSETKSERVNGPKEPKTRDGRWV